MKKVSGIILIVIALFIACDNPFWSNSPSKQSIIEYTYDDEAALMGMAYYDLYTPVDSIAQRIYNEIALIDSQYYDVLKIYEAIIDRHGDDSSKTSKFIRYVPSWMPSYLGFTFDLSTIESILDSTHEQFYRILDSLGTKSFKVREGTPYGELRLNGLKNPTVVLSVFDNIPEIINVYPSTLFFDQSLLIPYFQDENSKYFYNFRYGDCYSGCGSSTIFYFEIHNDSAVLLAKYNTATDTTVRPPWTDTLILALKMWDYSE